MRVGIDISPLALTRAGTARYLQELLPRLHQRVELVQLAFGGARPPDRGRPRHRAGTRSGCRGGAP